VICKDNTSVEAAHIRFSDSKYVKKNPGVGQKPHDFYVVPLCGKHHREQHRGHEQTFWNKYKINPILLALKLYAISGNAEEAERIIYNR
jgi:hypothetical protein